MKKVELSPEKYKKLKRYAALNKQIKVLKEERELILSDLFQDTDETSILVEVDGKTVVSISKSECNAISWKLLAEDLIPVKKINKVKIHYTNPYDRYTVKL